MTYFAVFLALLAMAYAVGKTLATPENTTPDTAIGLFVASLVMGLITVAQSIFSVSIKLFGGKLIYKPLNFEWGRWFLFMIIPIIVLSICGAHRLKKDSKNKHLPWILEIIVIFVAGVVAFCLNKANIEEILGLSNTCILGNVGIGCYYCRFRCSFNLLFLL